MSQKKSRLKRKVRLIRSEAKYWVSERIKKFFYILGEKDSIGERFAFNTEGLNDLELKRINSEFISEISQISASSITKKHLDGFLIEFFFYLRLRAFANVEVAKVKNKKPKIVDNKHAAPKAYSKWFGTRISKKRIGLKKWEYGESLSPVTDTDFFVDKNSYDEQVEDMFGICETHYANILYEFLTAEEEMPNRKIEYNFNYKNFSNTVIRLDAKIIIATYIALLHIKTTAPKLGFTKNQVEARILHELLDLSFDLISRPWMWIVSKEGEDIPFSWVPILFDENKTWFIPIARTVALVVFPLSYKKDSTIIPFDKITEDDGFLAEIGKDMDKVHKTMPLYFSPKATRLATHPNFDLF